MEMGNVQPGNAAPEGVASVRYNAFNQPGKHAGKSVSQIRAELGGIWGIPNDATPFINDKKVDDSTTISEGDTLVFHRKSGDKGTNALTS